MGNCYIEVVSGELREYTPPTQEEILEMEIEGIRGNIDFDLRNLETGLIWAKKHITESGGSMTIVSQVLEEAKERFTSLIDEYIEKE